MKRTIFIMFVVIVLGTSAQPFLSTDKVWSTMVGPVSGCSSFYCSSYFTKFAGDTLIEGIQYMKVLHSKDQQMKNWTTQGFIREDSNKKVFYRDVIAKGECQLYDFGCKTGDTLFLNCACRESGFLVDSIKTIVTDGIPRKSFYLTYLRIKTHEVWIEGIGSTMGILNGGSFNHCMTGGGEALLCYYEAGIKKYQSPVIQNYCYLSPDIINGIILEKAVSKFKVYPNPVSGELFVQPVSTVNIGYTLELVSVKGELLRTECVEAGNSPYVLNVSSLKKGIYLLRMSSDSGWYEEEVIIKQ